MPLDDAETYAMLRRGETTGVFQMESGGMRSLIKLLEPDRFEDLMALVALYRPGPLNNGLHTEYAERKHGRKPVTYPHPDLETILQGTYGVMVYQEQVMQIAVAMAGFSMGEADTLRKAMGKKKIEYLMPFKERFVKGAVERGYAERAAADMFEMFVPFADYGFNASHACAYGLVAYQTAYLMAHHPVAYMAAILTSVKDDKDRKPYYLYACRAMGIEVLPPDVNDSTLDFAPAGDDDQAIRYGLSAVRNVGDAAVQQVMEARAAKGRFESFSDFCRKVDPSVLTKRALESLILAGAFDSLGYRRRALLIGHDKVSGPIVAERKAEAAGQFSLFGGDAEVGQIDESVLAGEEFDKPELLRFEKEMLGSFVSDHPLLEVADDLRAQSTHEIGDLERRGRRRAGDGRRHHRRCRQEVHEARGALRAVPSRGSRGRGGGRRVPVGLRGGPGPDLRGPDRAGGRADRPTGPRAPDPGERRARADARRGAVPAGGESVVIDLTAAACTDAVLSKMAELLRSRPGSAPVRVRFHSTDGVRPLDMGAFLVDPSAALMGELAGLLGSGAARVERVV